MTGGAVWLPAYSDAVWCCVSSRGCKDDIIGTDTVANEYLIRFKFLVSNSIWVGSGGKLFFFNYLSEITSLKILLKIQYHHFNVCSHGITLILFSGAVPFHHQSRYRHSRVILLACLHNQPQKTAYTIIMAFYWCWRKNCKGNHFRFQYGHQGSRSAGTVVKSVLMCWNN